MKVKTVALRISLPLLIGTGILLDVQPAKSFGFSNYARAVREAHKGNGSGAATFFGLGLLGSIITVANKKR